MKVFVLTEDTPYNCRIQAEHGLSLFIETHKHKILFDTGQSAKFAENAERLGVDLSKVDIAVLSHGHYDHGGGVRLFFELNKTAPVYISEYAFGSYYNGAQKYIGLDRTLKKNLRFIFTSNMEIIDDELNLYSGNDLTRKYKIDNAGLSEKKNGMMISDNFTHEQYLIIRENGKKTVISGCSHKGVLNVMNWFKPDVLIGGFHFMNQEISEYGNSVLDKAAEVLCGYDAKYYTCHCTGIEQFKYLKGKMGEKLNYISAGQTVII